MSCYRPIPAWRGPVNDSGKRSLVFDSTKNQVPGSEILLPCGKCVGCRLERSRQWAMRCVHESELYDRNCFLTLTYSDEKLPEGGTLVLEDFQKFMKKLRKRFPEEHPRYFMCGEYGEEKGRPHYHACLFNFDFDDKVLWSTRDGVRLYTSCTLNTIWGHGYCVIGDVTFDSAAYVARYILKKQLGADSVIYKQKNLRPEFTSMSRRPGIGAGWYDSFKADIIPSDRCVINGKEVQPPRYYFSRLERDDPVRYLEMKEARKGKMKFVYPYWLRINGYPATLVGQSYRRLKDKEYIKEQTIKALKRNFEKGLT